MSSKSETVAAAAKSPDQAAHQPPEYARFPIWWWLLVAAGLLVSVAVSSIDQAFSYLVAVVTIFVGILIFLCAICVTVQAVSR